MEKSFVAMEQHCCVVCGTTFDTGNLVFDTRLRDRFDRYAVTGFDFCPEHKRMKDEGYVALVAIDESRSRHPLNPANVYRTGGVAHVREEAWPAIFTNAPVPDRGLCYVEPEVLEKLAKLTTHDA